MNVNELRAQMVRNGFSVEQFGAKIGLKKSAIYRRLSGKVPFSHREMEMVKDVLELDDTQIVSIFFDPKVS